MVWRNLVILAVLGGLVGVGGGLLWKNSLRSQGAAPTELAAAESESTPASRAVAQCDALGGHPDDPERLTEGGVDDEQLDGEAVVTACEKALKVEPDSGRLHFQLARGLLMQGDADAAIEHLTIAAEAEHGGALAALGGILLGGLEDLEADPDKGMQLLELAIAAGFEPAEAMLAEAQKAAEAVVQQAQVAPPSAPAASAPAASRKPVNFAAYELPRFMEAIYQGRYGDTGLNEIGNGGYAINMATAFRQTCRGPFTTAEIEGWKSRFIGNAMRPEVAGQALANGLGMMIELMQNPQAAAQKYAGAVSTDQIPMMAQQDAMSFISEHGCDGPVFERFTTNLRQSVR